MNAKIKSIIKYIIIFVLVVSLVLLAIFIIFPKPKKTDVYNYTLSLNENQNLQTVNKANKNLIEILNSFEEDSDLNLQMYYKFKISNNILLSLQNTSQFNVKKLAYTTNTKTYNTNCKEMKKLLSKIENSLEEQSNYISSQLESYLNALNHTAKTTNTYSFAMYNLNTELIENFSSYIFKSCEIVSELEHDTTLNKLSNKMLSVLTCWNTLQFDNLNNNENDFEMLYKNSEKLLSFSNKLERESKQYYNQIEKYTNLLNCFESVNLNDILLKVNTSLENNFTESIQDEELLTKTNNVLTFLKEA